MTPEEIRSMFLTRLHNEVQDADDFGFLFAEILTEATAQLAVGNERLQEIVREIREAKGELQDLKMEAGALNDKFSDFFQAVGSD